MKGFFQGKDGQLSSKRLAFLTTIPASIVGTLYFCNKLINKGKPDLAIDIWNSFLIFILVLGGFVSAELISNVASHFISKKSEGK